ncbi:MAG: YnfA family protein [Campylobacteraceae bacterium]|jgi:small multidrug resistance family-3 protein|nr:YnfA family protein [Campylobacteraceae bacterium]
MLAVKTLSIFFLAGLCEIGGGYLIWLWLRSGKHWSYGLLGGIILALYGVMATLQPSNFARVYAAYGGIFILMSVLWGMKFDGFLPDRYDAIGIFIVLIGVFIIYFAPRG